MKAGCIGRSEICDKFSSNRFIPNLASLRFRASPIVDICFDVIVAIYNNVVGNCMLNSCDLRVRLI